MENKKYYWLKLQSDFFKQPRIKKLRKIAGGDTYTIIYLELQLLSLQNNGVLVFEGIEDDFIEELALTLDEDVDNVKVTVMYLINQGLMQEIKQDEYAMLETMKNIGSETQGAKRVREHRKRVKALQCNTDVTNCNTEIDIEKDKDIDKEIEEEKRKDIKHKYGAFKHVLLTDAELSKLQNEFGSILINECIKFLDEYIEEKGYKSKSHNLAIRRWVIEAVRKRQPKGIVQTWEKPKREVLDPIELLLNRYKELLEMQSLGAEVSDAIVNIELSYKDLTGRDIEKDVKGEEYVK